MRENGSGYRVKPLKYFGFAIAIVAVFWGFYFMENHTDYRVTRRGSTPSKKPIGPELALIATILAPLASLVFWQRAVGIAKNGVPVTAEVIGVGELDSGERPVHYFYVYEDVKYQGESNVKRSLADRLKIGDPLEIVVDKRKPTRVLVKE